MAERDDLVAALRRQRFFLTNTLRELSDEQARSQPAASELSLGGLIKHVGRAEAQWMSFLQIGPDAMGAHGDEEAMADWMSAFAMTADETVADVLAGYEAVAEASDELILGLPDLDAAQPLPEAPWFEPGATWTARRVVLHVLAEIAQHAGHADLLREAIDGAKSMG